MLRSLVRKTGLLHGLRHLVLSAVGVLGKDVVMPTPYPKEFREDVIRVARQGDASTAQVARDFGISESCLNRWLKIADGEDSPGPPLGVSTAEVRRLKARNRVLEQENEILRRAAAFFAKDISPK